MNDELRQRLLNSDQIPEETKRRLAGSSVPVVTGMLTTETVADGHERVERQPRTNADWLKEHRARKAEERAQLEAARQADEERAAGRAPLEKVLERLDLSGVSKDTLRRLKNPVLVQPRDGGVSFKHDRGILDDARIAGR